MDSASDTEELPYVVWYQCRMCTHLFLDDIEKLFMHFEKKHGAMIDCEELKSIVYKNGLAMGGLSRSPKALIKCEDENETETELISPHPNSLGGDDEDELDKSRLQPEDEGNEMVLSNVHNKEDYADQNYDEENEGVDEDYEESDYKPEDTNDKSYVHNVNDDEEQLPEGDFDFKSAEINHQDEESDDGRSEENTQLIDPSKLCQTSSLQDYDEYDEQDNQEDGDGDYNDNGVYDEGNYLLGQDNNHEAEDYDENADYNDEGNYNEEEEEGELPASARQSMNEDDLNDLIYGEEMDYDDVGDEDDIGNHGMYSNQANQSGEILNYGFSCKFCGKFFTTRRGVESHEQHHKSQPSPLIRRTHEGRLFPCRICKDKAFPSFKDLKMHVKSHTPERIHICKFCFCTFNNTASLTKHLTIHTRENPHKCHCGKTFVSANTLKIHKKIHTGIKPFVCSFFQCGRSFVTKSTLESHIRTHTGEKPYQCSFCPSSFTTSSAKYRHERHVHKVPEPSIM